MAPKKDSAALAKAAPAELAEFNPRDPQTLLATAKQLAQFVTDNKLASQIQGRNYVQVEGWQFLFAVAGLDVICTKPTRLHAGRPDTEICYEAEARLFDQAGREVGYGYAICSDAERLKRGWAEFSIASMAQTRCIGKAGRNRFAFVMKAAGFEPTPAEEMSEVGTSASTVADAPKKPAAEASAPASAPPAASIGADQRIAGPAEIPAEILAKLTRQIEATTSGVDLQALWQRLTKPEAAALFDVKEAQKGKLLAAGQQAAATVVRQHPAAMKDAGSDSALVDEFEAQPLFNPKAETVDYATGEQKDTINSLLNHPLITRKEKTKLLISINKLDRERARQAIIKLREAIGQREGTDPRDGARASIKAFLLRNPSTTHADQLTAVAEDADATLDALLDALDGATQARVDDETYGTDAELAEADEPAAIAA